VSDMATASPVPESLMLEVPPREQRNLTGLLRWAWNSWATRSLVVGAAATVLDICVLLTCVNVLGYPNPLAAAVGVTFGSAFTFFANRHFAFKDRSGDLRSQAAKFMGATACSMVIHASFVWMLADRMGVNVVIAKMIADVAVFSVGQLLVLRYLVFPKAPMPAASEALELSNDG
jgi:putative flippase GtrA